MKEKIKHINIITIVVILSLITLLIGTPYYKGNVYIINIILSTYGVLYFIMQIILKKKIEINSLDMCILLLAISSLGALILRKYISLTGTIENIFKLFSIVSFYLIIKNECKENQKNKKIIINAIIISILILCLIGIDEINLNLLENFKKIIKYKYIYYDEVRICSLFAYPNTMAVVAGFGIFLCLGEIFENKKVIPKILYSITTLIMAMTMILTYSRLVYLTFALILIFYILIICKKYKIQEKLSAKKIAIVIALIISAIIYIVIGLHISKKVKIKDEYQKILYTVESNKDYTFEFEIEETASCEIKFTEKSIYFDDIKETILNIEKFEGKKSIKIHTTENTKALFINIYTKNGVTIKKAKINEKELILKYKILPTNIVDKLSSISLKNRSAWERLNFMQDAYKATKESWLVGLGGEAWQGIQLKVQKYNYSTLDAHSFVMQTFLENGILGLIACIGIYIELTKILLKQCKQKDINMSKVSQLIAIIFILVHSMLDINMSYYYVFITVITAIAIISSEKEKNRIIKKSNIIYIIVIMLLTVVLYNGIVKESFIKTKQATKVTSEWTEDKIYNMYYTILPFDKEVKEKKYKADRTIKNYKENKKMIENLVKTEKTSRENLNLNNIYNYIKLLDNNENKKIEIMYNYICETEEYCKYANDIQITRLVNLKNIAKYLENNKNIEYANKIKEQFNKEYKERKTYILDYQKLRYNKNLVEQYEQELEKIKEDIIVLCLTNP